MVQRAWVLGLALLLLAGGSAEAARRAHGPKLLGAPRAAKALPKPKPQARGQFADVDGGKIFYETCGTGPRTIVLLHDGLLDSRAFDGVWPSLCRSFRVVRYDRRGYGRSPAATAAYSALDDLAAVLKAAKVDRAVLVGSSAGADLAIQFALEQPRAVDRLVLIAPTLSGVSYSKAFLNGMAALRAPVETGKVKPAILAMADSRLVLAPGHPAARRRFVELLTASPQDLTHPDPAPLPLPAKSRLYRIQAPTLVLVGASDVADNEAHAGAVGALIPGARLTMVPGAGHLIYLEEPQAFAEQVSAFLKPPSS